MSGAGRQEPQSFYPSTLTADGLGGTVVTGDGDYTYCVGAWRAGIIRDSSMSAVSGARGPEWSGRSGLPRRRPLRSMRSLSGR